MRWWSWRPRPRCPTPGEQAKREAEAELEQVQERWPEVRERAESLRAGRERNGFGEAMLALFRGEHL